MWDRHNTWMWSGTHIVLDPHSLHALTRLDRGITATFTKDFLELCGQDQSTSEESCRAKPSGWVLYTLRIVIPRSVDNCLSNSGLVAGSDVLSWEERAMKLWTCSINVRGRSRPGSLPSLINYANIGWKIWTGGATSLHLAAASGTLPEFLTILRKSNRISKS